MAAVRRRGELPLADFCGAKRTAVVQLAQLEEISEHVPALFELLGRLSGSEASLADIRIVLASALPDLDFGEIYDQEGMIAARRVAYLALGVGLGIDVEDAEGKPDGAVGTPD